MGKQVAYNDTSQSDMGEGWLRNTGLYPLDAAVVCSFDLHKNMYIATVLLSEALPPR